MTIAKVQSVVGNGATLVLNGVAAGNLLTLQSAAYANPASHAAEATPTDSQGIWSTAISPTPATFNSLDVNAAIFYQANVASGTHTVTPATMTAANRTLVEWSAAVASPFDVSASGTTSETAHTSRTTGTTASTAQADELSLIAHSMGALNGVADVGYTDPVTGYTTLQRISNDASDLGTFHAYKVLSSAGTQSATFNWTASESVMGSQGVIATFKAATGGGATVTYPQLERGLRGVARGVYR